jgi:hypothetical protein
MLAPPIIRLVYFGTARYPGDSKGGEFFSSWFYGFRRGEQSFKKQGRGAKVIAGPLYAGKIFPEPGSIDAQGVNVLCFFPAFPGAGIIGVKAVCPRSDIGVKGIGPGVALYIPGFQVHAGKVQGAAAEEQGKVQCTGGNRSPLGQGKVGQAREEFSRGLAAVAYKKHGKVSALGGEGGVKCRGKKRGAAS